MAELIERLVRRSSQFETETAWSVADAGHLHCAGAPLRDFVPLPAEHDEALHVLWTHSGGAAQSAAGAGGALL